MAVADIEQRRLDALGLDRLAMHERHPEGGRIMVCRLVQVEDGDPDVVDRPEHDRQDY